MGNEISSIDQNTTIRDLNNKVLMQGISQGINLNKTIIFMEKLISKDNFDIKYTTDKILSWPDLRTCYNLTVTSWQLLYQNATNLSLRTDDSVFGKNTIIYWGDAVSLSWIHMLCILAIRFELIKNVCHDEVDMLLSNTSMSIAYIKVILKRLIVLGVDVNGVDSNGNTCLHYLAKTSWIELVDILKNAGADVSIRNLDGDLPRSIAARCFNDPMRIFLTK